MSTCEQFTLMTAYNAAMNQQIYLAAASLSPSELQADRKAYFGSIIGTLNHLVVADTIWLKRFSAHPGMHSTLDAIRAMPAPTSLSAMPDGDFATLHAHRQQLDHTISLWIAQLSPSDLDYVLPYASMKGVPAQKRCSSLLMHFFNHQTHHRGQASTLLFQAGVDIGVTDLLVWIPNEH